MCIYASMLYVYIHHEWRECIYVYVYTCTSIYIYMGIYVWMNIRIRIYMHMYIYMYVYICIYVHMCIYVYMYICIQFISIYVYILYVNMYLYLCIYIYVFMYICIHFCTDLDACPSYGVATISRLLKMIGLFCKRALWNRRYSAMLWMHFVLREWVLAFVSAICYEIFVWAFAKCCSKWMALWGGFD